MAKKAKITHTPQPYRAARRRGIGWSLEGTANALENTRKGMKRYMRSEIHGRIDYNSLDGVEQRHFDEAMKELKQAEKRLRGIAKRCQREVE